MNKKQNLISLAIASCLCLGSVTASAIPTVSFNVLDPFITVGETFQVQVYASSFPTGEDLLGFGFNVDPLSTLTKITYAGGYTMGSGFSDFSAGGNNVAGIALPAISTDPALLATVSFTAGSVGTDSLRIQGMVTTGLEGLYFTQSSTDIDASQLITVNPQGVPDSSSLWMAAMTLTGLCALRMGLRKQTR